MRKIEKGAACEMMDSENDSGFPEFPSGLWRRVVLHPGPGWIGGALEDDMHRFHMRFDHDGARILGVKADAVRHPWTGCSGAPPHIAADLKGELLSEVAAHDPRQHCTHLIDLAALMAAHANDLQPSIYDMRVADRVDGRTTATLELNGKEQLRWRLDGSVIQGPGPFSGRDTKALSSWKSELPPVIAEQALMLRRTLFVSSARNYKAQRDMKGTQSPLAVHRPCFNFQPEQVEDTRSLNETREFSQSGHEPLEHFDPVAELGCLT